MLTPEFPEWVPLAVARVAQHALASDGGNAAIVLRLARDKQMEAVWREVGRRKPVMPRPKIDEHLKIGPSALLSCHHLTDQEAGLTLFFYYAYFIASLPISISTRSELADLRDLYTDQAGHLRAVAKRLRGLALLPVSSGGILGDGGVSALDAVTHADAVEREAKFCDKVVAAFSVGCATDHTLIVDRNSENALTRGYIRALANGTRDLFGTALYGTLATVTNVALDLREDEKVTREMVIKWCTNKNA